MILAPIRRRPALLVPTLLYALLLAGTAAAADLGTAPPLRARDLDGERFELAASLEEGPAVITFWATWCKPCLKELPELQELREEFADRGFHVVAVNGDGPVDRGKVRPYVRARGFDFTVIPDPDGEIRRRFQVEVFPTTFLVAPDGTIRHRQVGYRQGDEEVLRDALEALLGADAPDASPDGGR